VLALYHLELGEQLTTNARGSARLRGCWMIQQT
jgi:hypothetical protein